MYRFDQQTSLILAYISNLIFRIPELYKRRTIFETSYYTLVVVQLISIARQKNLLALTQKQP
jgi:hypothetical protein